MRKQLLSLLLALIAMVGYAQVYVEGQILYNDDSTLNVPNSGVLTDYISIGNATEITISWEDISSLGYAVCAYNLEGNSTYDPSPMVLYETKAILSETDLSGYKNIRFRFRKDVNISNVTIRNIKVIASSVRIDYSRPSLTIGNLGTICLPNGIGEGEYRGAKFYKVAGKTAEEVYFTEVTRLEAGKPYVFEATETALSVVYSGEPVATPGNGNGLYGVFENFAFSSLTDQELEDIYIIKNNEVRKASAASGVNANRAYLKLNDIPTIRQAPEGRTLVLGYEQEESGSQTGVGDIGREEEDAPQTICTLQGQRVMRVVKDDLYIVNHKEVKYLRKR